MKEFRRDVPLSTESQYWFVEMGSIPDMPGWHQQMYKRISYPFPTEEAAIRFAAHHKKEHWKRDIAVVHPDGTREEIV